MKLKINQVVGLNTDQKAAQVISSVQDEDNTFLGVIMLSSDDAFTKGRSALSELSDFYFDFEGSASEKINAAFEQAAKVIGEGTSYDLLLAAISGKILYLVSQGEMEVYLNRAGKLSPLLAVGASSQLISGFLAEGDKLLFATKSLITFLGEDLENSLNLPPDSFEEEIESRIGASTLENQGLATLIIEVESENQPEIAGLPNAALDQPQQFSPGVDSEQPAILQTISDTGLNLFAKGKKYFPRSGRGRLIVAIILIIIVGLGVGLKYNQSKNEQKQLQFNRLIQGAKDDFDAAKGLATLNPTAAKGRLDSAKHKVSEALGLKPNDNQAQTLKGQIEADSSTILQESAVADFPQFLDMELVKKNFRAKSFSLSSGKLLVLDPSVKTLVILDLAKKSNQILAGSEQLGDALFASLNGELAFLYSKDKGILRVDSTNKKITVVSKPDSDWGQIADIYSFAGNVYLLDTAKNMIWKYLPTADGYSDKREYFTKGSKNDLAAAFRMQIESSVYVLKNGGEISRFTKGDKDNFSLGGLPSAVKNPQSLFISSDTDNLYLLDSGNSRLLVLTKTGNYKGQITGSKFATATDLVVDEKGKKVYLLEGAKIYTADLK